MQREPTPAQRTAEALDIRRTRAARWRVRRQALGNAFDPELVERVAATLSDAEVDADLLEIVAAREEEARKRLEDLQVENLRHEGARHDRSRRRR